MAPNGQRTFTLVPISLVAEPARDSRPMTSKAAKKAYQKANRGPKVTRAEQRRLDAEEREREKKEFEREKAATKARAAREKKAEKENAAKQERRKKGIPEPNRFVRPSQPTISRFVRTDGGKRKWQDTESVGDDSEGTVAEDEEAGRRQPPAKRLAMIAEDEEGATPPKIIPNQSIVIELPSGGRSGNLQSQLVQRKQDPESEDEFGEFPTFTQVGLLEKLDSPMLLPSRKSSACAVSKVTHQAELEEPKDLIELPARPVIDEDYLFDDSQQMSDMANAQLMSDVEAVTKSDEVELNKSGSLEAVKPVMHFKSVNRSRQWASTKSRVPDEKVTTVPTRQYISHPKFKLPPIPSRSPGGSRKPFAQAVYPQPKIKQTVAPLPRKVISLLPTSTQTFLEDNLDAFMPTPSQEMRELFDDIDDEELPSNTQIAREISPMRPNIVTNPQPKEVDEIYDDLICSQDFILSSQDMREISPVKSKSAENRMQKTFPKPPKKQIEKPIPQPVLQKQMFDESIFDDFPSTQDLTLTPEDFIELSSVKTKPIDKPVEKQSLSKSVTKQGTKPKPPSAFRKEALELSIFDEFPSTQELTLTPEDLKELKTPSRGPLRTINNLKKEMSLLLGEVQKPKKGPAPKAQVPTNQAVELPRIGIKPTEKPAKKPKDPPKAKATAREKRRFFEEKETDIVRTPIHEGKSIVQSKTPLPPLNVQGTPDAETRALEAAIQESKLMAQQMAPASNRHTKSLQQAEAEILEAVIQESKHMAQKTQTIPSIPPPATGKTQQGKRFFQEKETDLVEAAIQASRTTAQRRPAVPPPQQGKRFFQEKETDLVEAAIQASKMTAQKSVPPAYQSRKMPLRTSDTNTTRTKRTLQRVQSVVTDYGDDDLTEQDLLGLC